MNLFIAGLPLHTSESDLRVFLTLLDLQAIEPHVRLTQNTFAFVQVPPQQISFACEKYDGVEYRKQLIRVSAVRRVLGCRKCMSFGHCADECVPLLARLPQTPRSEQPRNKPIEQPLCDSPTRSILFAKEWNPANDCDEWPCRERQAEVQIGREVSFEDAFHTPPPKRLRKRVTPFSSMSQISMLTLSQSSKKVTRHMLAELRVDGSASFAGCHFRLIKSAKSPNRYSRVVCGVCKTSILVRNVPKHVSSKGHQKAAQDSP